MALDFERLRRTAKARDAAGAASVKASWAGVKPLPAAPPTAAATTPMAPMAAPNVARRGGVSTGGYKAELASRRAAGDYTLPGSDEETLRTLQQEKTKLFALPGVGLPGDGQHAGGQTAWNSSKARDEKIVALENRINAKKDAYWRVDNARKVDALAAVRNAPDFAQTVEMGKRSTFDTSGLLLDHPKGRRLGNYLLHPAEKEFAQKRSRYSEADKIDVLTPDERDVMLYYLGKGDFGQFEHYWSALEQDLNARTQAQYTRRDTAEAEAHPFIGGATNAAASFLAPAAYLANLRQTAQNEASGTYTPTDSNSDAFLFAHIVNDTAEGVGQAGTRMPIAGDFEVGGQNVGRFLAESALSVGQTAARLPFGPTGALALAGGSAAGQGTLDALERGATPQQALAMGTADGLIETATEKIGLDRLFGIAGRSGRGGVMRALREIGGQMLTEGAEEAVSEVAGNLTDLAMMGDKAALQQYAARLTAQGVPKSEAEAAALKQFFLTNTTWSAAGGALSGGLMGGAGVLAGRLNGTQGVDETGAAVSAPTPAQAAQAGVSPTGAAAPVTQAATAAVLRRTAEEAVGLRQSTDSGAARTATGGAETTATQAPARAYEAAKRGDMQRLALRALGTHGQRAFQAALRPDEDAALYFAGFARYYNAGLAGDSLQKVSARYTADLSPDQRAAAWFAGRNDGADSLRTQRAQAEEAVRHEAPGFLPQAATADGAPAYARDTEVAALDGLGRALGVRVTVDAQVAAPDGQTGGSNGYYADGVIHIAADAESPMLVVAKHEATHRMQELAPEAYRKFRDYAMQLTDDADMAIERRKAESAGRGISLSNEGAMDEIAADLTEQLLTDKARIERLLRDDRSTAERFFDALKRVIQRIRAALGHAEPTLAQAERLWQEAFRAATAAALDAKTKNTAQSDGGQAQYSTPFAPEKHSIKRTPEQEAARLQTLNDYLKAQLKRTEAVQIDAKAVTKLSGTVLHAYSSGHDRAELTKALCALYTYMMSKDVTWETVSQRAHAVAEDILSASRVLNDESAREYRDLRSYLRQTRMTLGESDRADLSAYGGYEAFRKRQFGRLRLGAGGLPVDVAYAELAERWPMFFPDEITAPADQLTHMADVLDDLTPVYENPFSGQMEEAADYLAADLIEQFYDTPQARATYADRQTQKLTEQKIKDGKRLERLRTEKNEQMAQIRTEGQEKIKNAIGTERARRETAVTAVREHYTAKEKGARERQNARALRGKINRHVKALSQRLLRPSDRTHVPEALRVPVAEMLACINLESTYTRDPETGRREKGGTGDPLKRTEAFVALRRQYGEIATQGDEEMVVDPDLLDNLDAVSAMREIRLDEMSTGQLEIVWRTVRAVEASISTAGKLLSKGRYETISALGETMRADFATAKPFQERYGVRGMLTKLVDIDMLSPADYFEELGRAGNAIWDTLRGALDQKIRDTATISAAATALLGKTKHSDWSGKHATLHKFETEGGAHIQLTPAQVMSLYLLTRRGQAQEHILKGGIRQAPVEQGGKIVKSAVPVQVTVADLQKITDSLSTEQRRIADGLGAFMSTTLSDWGNEVSMALYGYQKFNETNYFPIQADENYTKTEFAAGADQRVKHMGFTKSTVPHAKNAIMIDDIFDVFTRHADDMSTYHAFAAALEDAERFYNFRYRGADGTVSGSISQTIETVLGREGKTYFRNLMRHLNEGIRADVGGDLPKKLLSNYKAAAVGANFRVIIQQPTSILRAGAMIHPKYLIAGAAKKGDFALVKKYAPIAQWKDWGYFQLDTGRQMKDILLGTDSTAQKLRSAAMAGAGWADNFTWAHLWNACALETADRQPTLTRDSEAFYEAVGARFGAVVDRTQVVDSVLHRTQMMRSGNTLVQMATSFMAEPAKTYNLFRTAARTALTHGTRENRAVLARTTVALLASGVANAAAAALIDALRDDEDDETYGEKFLQAFTGLNGGEETFWDYAGGILGGNLGDNLNPLGMVPYAKDILSIWQGYDIERMDMSAIKDFKDAADRLINALRGKGKYTVGYAVTDCAARGAKLLGLPLANIKRGLEALANGAFMAIEATGANINGLRWSWAKLKTPINQENKNNWIDMGYRFERQGDSTTAGQIYDALAGAGIDAETVTARKQTVLKKTDAFVDARSQSLGTVISALEQSHGYRALDEVQQEKARAAAADYAYAKTMLAQSEDYKLPEQYQWVEKADGGAAIGVQPWEFILWDVAYDRCKSRKENGKTVQGSKQEAAIKALTEMAWLSDRERDYLYGTKYTSEKNNPWR